MPKRTDIKKILLIGSGPIVIGQGCEFDYSGVQACKALKAEGFELVLVNSNPATIMTDPEFADRTYIEPLTLDSLHEIIRRERPDALLPTLGGQTALNLTVAAAQAGLFKRYQVELIGASIEAIRRAEDRDEFKKTMKSIGLEVPRSGSAHSMEEARAIAGAIGSWPLIIRPGFTLGGTGGGIAHDNEEFATIVKRGLDASLNSEVLIEESLVGWGEYELEVIRDRNNTSVIVCSIENMDPMGVHTGDSITIAPAQTLTDRDYQAMRDDSLRVMAAIGVETGGSNVQWAINPHNGRRLIVEMNPRVSRSSALASKATGFPIAKIAALLAVGYTLDELRNDITRSTPACFEPALDYVVTKIPRFTFEKFPAADSTLGTQMKSVGEAMAIGRNLQQSFQKALRSLETGYWGFGADPKSASFDDADDATVERELSRPNADRISYIHTALMRGWSVERISELTMMDRYFLRKLAMLVEFERALTGVAEPTAEQIRKAKEWGYSDRQLARMSGSTAAEMRRKRTAWGILPTYGTVDTCAGEFQAITPYYYSTYAEMDDPVREATPPKQRIMILGGGPNRIGQGIEFDYCCVHAAFALREAGYETIMVNSNPETVSTDYDTSDKLYFEPLCLEEVLNIYERERCDGVIVQFGGQTPLNLATELEANGVKIIGTTPHDIDVAGNREEFRQIAMDIGLRQPENGIAHDTEEAIRVAEKIGYPLLVRPSFVLGGRAMVIVYKEKYLRKFIEEAEAASEGNPILIDRFLEDAHELDVDCIADGETTVIGAIMEHVEPAGIHSGDSACSIPVRDISPKAMQTIRDNAFALAKALHVKGLMNIQMGVKGDDVYIIEVNPRASRTIPFVSKSIGIPLAKLASLVMAGKTLKELHFTQEVQVPYVTFKEAVFPFVKFPGVDIILSPEMKSTGEVMGIDFSVGGAFLRSQIAAGNAVPGHGALFLSLRDEDKQIALPFVKKLDAMGFEIYATRGTATLLYDHDIQCHAVYKITAGRPNLLDLLAEHKVQWVVNTPETGARAMVDEIQMRAKAVSMGIPVTTTVDALETAVAALEACPAGERMTVCSLQEYHRRIHHE